MFSLLYLKRGGNAKKLFRFIRVRDYNMNGTIILGVDAGMLAFHEVLRYGELKRLLEPITHKMLTNQLKELEKDGLIIRKEYPQVPPKVEYYMSEMGKGLRPVVGAMYEWIEKYDI